MRKNYLKFYDFFSIIFNSYAKKLLLETKLCIQLDFLLSLHYSLLLKTNKGWKIMKQNFFLSNDFAKGQSIAQKIKVGRTTQFIFDISSPFKTITWSSSGSQEIHSVPHCSHFHQTVT